MRTFKLLICLLSFQLTLYSLTAWAVPIANLYNTGLDASGNYLPTLGLDGNYTVISSPLGSFTPAAVDDTVYPFPSFWIANNPPFSLDILINGISTSQVSAGFSSLVGFSVTSGFNVGLNTLDFLVGQVGGGPTGLRVDKIFGSYNVPEPTSAALALLCLGGIVMRRRV
jgi:hypothetical protein